MVLWTLLNTSPLKVWTRYEVLSALCAHPTTNKRSFSNSGKPPSTKRQSLRSSPAGKADEIQSDGTMCVRPDQAPHPPNPLSNQRGADKKTLSNERRGEPALWVLCCAFALAGCHHPRFIPTPGETDTKIREVTFVSSTGEPLALNPKPLVSRLGLRAGNVVFPERYYNPFQLAEDRLRVLTHWQSFGYFDAEVSDPTTEQHDGALSVRWTITENTPYKISQIQVIYAQPTEHDAALRALIPFKVGDSVDLETYRRARILMAEHLRRSGFGHAMVYSRTFIDRAAKVVHWFYYVDAGPLTQVGEISVAGNNRVDTPDILTRMGFVAGEPLDQHVKDKAVMDLLDTGSFVSVVVSDDADVEFLVGKVPPDTGGELRPAQIDANGDIVARSLPEAVNLEAFVVEAPKAQAEADVGGGADFTRWDVTAGSTLWLRDVWASFGHVVAEGFLGYGDWWGGVPEGGDPSLVGVYGEGAVEADASRGGVAVARSAADGAVSERALSRLSAGGVHCGARVEEYTGKRGVFGCGCFVSVWGGVWFRGHRSQ